MFQFQWAGTKGIGFDDRGSGINICAMDIFHDFGIFHVHEFRTGSGLESAGLQHGAHGTIKDFNFTHTFSSCSGRGLFFAGGTVFLRTNSAAFGAMLGSRIILLAVQTNDGGDALARSEHHGGGETHADFFGLSQTD